MFKDIIQIQLPKYKGIAAYKHKSHNITHRFNFSKLNRMERSVID